MKIIILLAIAFSILGCQEFSAKDQELGKFAGFWVDETTAIRTNIESDPCDIVQKPSPEIAEPLGYVVRNREIGKIEFLNPSEESLETEFFGKVLTNGNIAHYENSDQAVKRLLITNEASILELESNFTSSPIRLKQIDLDTINFIRKTSLECKAKTQ